jgi:hypothetical protein
MVALGRMGFSPKEIQAAIADVLNLARATGTDLAEAGDIAANSLRIFGLEAGKMSDVSDVLTVTANSSAQTLTDLFEALKMGGPQAAAAGESIRETCASLAVLANLGIKGSLAGTALRKSFSQFAKVKVQEQLRAVGVETLDANGNLRKMAEIMRDIAKVMQTMPTAEKLAFAEDIFGVNTVVTTTVEGIDPFLILTVRNNAGLHDPIGHITYKADHDWNFKNNEEIKITATMDQKFADQGYMLTRTEVTISFDGFERYVSSASDLTNVVLHRISERAYQECVNGGNVDIFDGSNNMTPWGATIENIHVGDTALLAVNNQIEMEYSFLLVPVYKTISTEEWYDMDAGMNTTKTWENVIGYYKFTDLIIQSDGSVTFNESYVELNGNYTDANTADTLYLNQLRSNYTFIEVPMP